MQIWEGIDTSNSKPVQWRISPCYAYSGSLLFSCFLGTIIKHIVSLTFNFENFRFKSLNWISNRKLNKPLPENFYELNKYMLCLVYCSLLFISEVILHRGLLEMDQILRANAINFAVLAALPAFGLSLLLLALLRTWIQRVCIYINHQKTFSCSWFHSSGLYALVVGLLHHGIFLFKPWLLLIFVVYVVWKVETRKNIMFG